MNGVDEELARAAVRLAGVRHRQRAGLVRELRVRRVLILERAIGAVAGAGATAARVLAVRAAELEHEVVDDAVEVEAVVEAALRELHEVARGDGHLVGEQLDLDVAKRRLEERSGVRHGRGSYPTARTMGRPTAAALHSRSGAAATALRGPLRTWPIERASLGSIVRLALPLHVRTVHRRALRWLERRGHLERPRSKRLRMRPPCHPRSKLARRSRRSEGRCARSHPMPLARQTVREKPWVSTRMLHPAKEAL